jgi:hypothetical protein
MHDWYLPSKRRVKPQAWILRAHPQGIVDYEKEKSDGDCKEDHFQREKRDGKAATDRVSPQ